MGRLKQTLRLKEESKREWEKIKNETLLASLNEITWCHTGEQAKEMTEQASTEEEADLSGNKEQHSRWASEKVSRKAWLHCAFEKTMALRAWSKESLPSGANLPLHLSVGCPPCWARLATDCRVPHSDSALFDQQRRAGAQLSLLSCGACVATPTPRGAF